MIAESFGSVEKDPGPALSIIIPTFLRERVLWDTVADLRHQLRFDDELILIDQNRQPLRIPDSLADTRIRLARLSIASLTRARNLGISLAKHDCMVFLDDDIIPNPDLLAQFRLVATDHPGEILTGLVDQDDKPEDVPSPGTVDLHSGEIRTNFSRPVTGEVPFFPGGLALIPKSALPKQPWFCPSFRGASQGEEIDFALRARAQGKKIWALPAIRIFHLKAVEGGCRSPEFQRSFFLDSVFNQALFYGRNGKLSGFPRFLKRLKGFVEYHSRYPERNGHAPGLVLFALGRLAHGFAVGFLGRIGRM